MREKEAYEREVEQFKAKNQEAKLQLDKVMKEAMPPKKVKKVVKIVKKAVKKTKLVKRTV